MTLLATLALAYHSELEAAIETALAHSALAGASVAVSVLGPDGESRFERNADAPMVPASCMKLATLALAFERIDPEARPVTRFWKTEHGVVVDAPGDPGLQAAQLREARARLGEVGPDLYLRQAYAPGPGPGWQADDLPYDYAALAAAFAADRSRIVLRAEKGRLLVPAEAGLKVRRPTAKGAVRVQYDPSRSALTVSGALPSNKDIEEIAQPDPAGFAARLVGAKRILPAPEVPTRPPDHEIVGEPWLSHARECGEKSVNVLAEHLLFLASGQSTYPDAATVANSFWDGVVGAGAIAQSDGSGLSRRNRATARGLSRLLVWARGRPWWNAFHDSLAAAGEGTLEKRLAGSSFVGKTGTMRGVVGLSGVCVAADGTPLAVTVLVNGASRPAAQVRAVQDRVVRAVESAGRRG